MKVLYWILAAAVIFGLLWAFGLLGKVLWIIIGIVVFILVCLLGSDAVDDMF